MNWNVLSTSFSVDNTDFDPLANLCGSGRLACLVPQHAFGVDFHRACYCHDKRWDSATSIEDYHLSNAELRANVYKLGVAARKAEWFASIIADLFYAGVAGPVGRVIFECEMDAKENGAAKAGGFFLTAPMLAQIGNAA